MELPRDVDTALQSSRFTRRDRATVTLQERKMVRLGTKLVRRSIY